MFASRYMPCSSCGASVERSDSGHLCDAERALDYQLFGLRADIARLEHSFHVHLATSVGRFEVWLAARRVRDH